MKNRRLLIITLFILSLNSTYAQIAGYWNDYTAINPATTGLFNDYYLSFNGQFSEYANREMLGYNMRINSINSGVGVYIKNVDGINGNDYGWSSLKLNYAYHFQLKKNRKISLGAAGYFLSEKSSSINYQSLNFGMAYSTPKLLIGLAVDGFVSSTKEYSSMADVAINVSYLFSLGDKWQLKPEIFLQKDLIKLNTKLSFKEKYWIGLAYGYSSYYYGPGFSYMAGYNFKSNLRISYAITSVNTYHRDNNFDLIRDNTLYHEIMLAFKIGD